MAIARDLDAHIMGAWALNAYFFWVAEDTHVYD